MNLKTFCEKYELSVSTAKEVAQIISDEFETEHLGGPVVTGFLKEPDWRGTSWSGRDPSVGIFSGYYEELETTDQWSQDVLDELRKLNEPAHTSIVDDLLESVTNERLESR